MPTISTRYLPPTNTKGARVKAWITNHTGGPSVTVDYHSHDKPHEAAALMLAQGMTYKGKFFYAGPTDDGKGDIFVYYPCLAFDTRTGA